LTRPEPGHEQVESAGIGVLGFPCRREFLLGLRQVSFTQRKEAQLQSDIGVGRTDFAQGGASLAELADALVSQSDKIGDLWLLAARAQRLFKKPGSALELVAGDLWSGIVALQLALSVLN